MNSVAALIKIVFALTAAMTGVLLAAEEPRIPVLTWGPRSDWINVRAAGAKGDGTTDDTEAIQQVLTA